MIFALIDMGITRQDVSQNLTLDGAKFLHDADLERPSPHLLQGQRDNTSVHKNGFSQKTEIRSMFIAHIEQLTCFASCSPNRIEYHQHSG